MSLNNIIEIKEIRSILQDKKILLKFFNELIEKFYNDCPSLIIDELNEYDEDIMSSETDDDDYELWDK